MSVLIKNGNIITFDESRKVINGGGVYIEDDKIIEIGKTEELEKKYSTSDEIIDAKSRLVMPGFINAHMHFYSAFATGMPLPPFPKGFVNVLENLWWKLDKALLADDIYHSALLGYIQSLKSGTTTVADHHASPSHISGSLDLIERAAQELGVRSNLCYEVSNRNCDEEAGKGLQENDRFIKKCNSSEKELISGSLGLHAAFTLSDDSLSQAQQIVERQNTGIHIHVAEGKADMDHSKENFNKTVIQRLDDFALLGNKAILAHCIHLDEVDYPILQKSSPNITHQPRSNMNNAVGTMDIWKLNELNIPFGLGTDGMSSDMKAEMMVGSLIHKHDLKDNTVGMAEIFNSQFYVNPRIIKNITGVDTGKLIPNYKADLIISNYYPKSPVGPDNIMGHILFGVIHESIDYSIINGRVCMREGIIPGIDESLISKKCEVLAKRVWERVGNQ